MQKPLASELFIYVHIDVHLKLSLFLIYGFRTLGVECTKCDPFPPFTAWILFKTSCAVLRSRIKHSCFWTTWRQVT